MSAAFSEEAMEEANNMMAEVVLFVASSRLPIMISSLPFISSLGMAVMISFV